MLICTRYAVSTAVCVWGGEGTNIKKNRAKTLIINFISNVVTFLILLQLQSSVMFLIILMIHINSSFVNDIPHNCFFRSNNY
jgi:hypothetical protein